MSHHAHIPPELDLAVRSFIRRHKRMLRWALVVVPLLAVLLGVAAMWALWRGASHMKDWVANQAPSRIPLSWEQPLGEAALAQIRSRVRFVSDPQVLKPLQDLAAPLLNGPANSSDRFTLFVADAKEINAFALPGGFIVFNRGLLESARTPEEILGVLAHEMAHVQKRHGVLQLAQNMGFSLALQRLQGSENGLRESLIRDSAKLLGFKFSRDHVRAADDLGWELLGQAQINPQGMVDFFARLKSDADATGSGSPGLESSLLSTHPTPQERIDRLRQKQSTLVNREFKSFAPEFDALRAGLGRP